MRRERTPLGAAIVLLVGTMAALAQVPDRSTPPQPGPPPDLTLPSIQRHTLGNGLPVWIVERHEVPIVQVNLLVRAGSAADPPDRFGLASLTAAMLREGAGERSSPELADAVELLGASLSTASTYDASSVRLNVPVDRLDEALPLMADVARRPAFAPEELERLRQQRLTGLKQARDDPAAVASAAFARMVFGRGHRYGTGTVGTPASLARMAVEDLRPFHESHYHAGASALVVVGDISAADALRLLEPAFGDWTRGDASPAVTAGPVREAARREIYLIDHPGAAQSQVRIGGVGVARETPDYFPLLVLNTILGGSFTSRLNQNLRETHGYAYGAGSSFDMRTAPGPFTAAAGVQTDRTAEALTEFFNELEGILVPVPQEELRRARNYLSLRFPGAFETTGGIAARLEEKLLFGLPDDYFDRYVEHIEAVDRDDVARVAWRYITPDRFTVVVVGDLRQIEAGIRALDLGPVHIVEADEVLD